MAIEIKRLKEPYDYAQIANVLRETYFKEYGQAGALQWNEKYAKFYFDAIIPKGSSREYLFGAFDGNKLVGTVFGHRDVVIFENRLRLEMANLGLTAVLPEYKRQGIATKLVARAVEQAKEKNLDFIMAFPEKERYGDKICEKLEFQKFGKTKHYIKLMEERGLQVIREYLHYNIILVKLASLYSHLPKEIELDGIVRYAKIEETDKVCEIINSYASRVPLVNFYSLEGYKQSNMEFARMNERFGDPWGFHWVVLERNGKILATLTYRIEIVTFEVEPNQYESGPVALLSSPGCHEMMDLDEKVQFFGAVLRKIRTDQPEVYVCQIVTPQHEQKAFDKLKFVDDRSTYYLYMLPLTEKGEELKKYKKYKKYHLQYFR